MKGLPLSQYVGQLPKYSFRKNFNMNQDITKKLEPYISKKYEETTARNKIREGIAGWVDRPTFRIINSTPSDSMMLLQHIRESYFQDEPVMKALSLSGPNLILENIIIGKLTEGTSLVAVPQSKDKKIYGLCLGCSFCTSDVDRLYAASENINAVHFSKLFHFLTYVKGVPQLHEKFGDAKIWDIFLLSTNFNHRQKKIATSLAKRSLVLARNLGYRYARFDCTSYYCSRIAKKLGMDLTWAMRYADFTNKFNESMFCTNEPHRGVEVYTLNLQSQKLQDYEEEIRAEEVATAKYVV